MWKKDLLDKENSLEIIRIELTKEIKDKDRVDVLVLSISNLVQDLIPVHQEESLFREIVEKIIIIWKKSSTNKDPEKLKESLIEVYFRKKPNKFLDFTNKNPGIISVAALISSVVVPLIIKFV